MSTLTPFGISVCGIEELGVHSETGITHILSILDPGCPVPEVFNTFGEHRKLELRFHDVIEASVGSAWAPRIEHVVKLLAFGRDLVAEPQARKHLLVHCQAGISRSTAAMTLILAQTHPCQSARQILQAVLRVRPKAWPNLRIIELGDAILGRNGDIVAATAEVYRRQLESRPELAEFIIQGGRARELVAARGGDFG